MLNVYELKNIEVLEDAISMRTEEDVTDSETEDMPVVEEGDRSMEMSGETYSTDPQYYEEYITTTITTNDYGDGWVSTEVDDDGNYFDEVVSGAWFDDSGIPCSMLLKNIQKQTNEWGQMYIVGIEYYSNTPVVINGNFDSGLVNGDNILAFAKYTGLASDDTPNFQGFYIEIENGRF